MAGKTYLGFRVDVPQAARMAVFYNKMPGVIVSKIHHRIVGKVAQRGVKVMKAEIKRRFPLYSPGQTRANGQPLRWQTPTHALENSVGMNVLKMNKMRRSGVAVAYFGPRWDFKVRKTVRKRIDAMSHLGLNTAKGTPFGSAKPAPAKIHIPRGPKGETVSPARYAHLANFGHEAGRGPVKAKPNDYMTPTMNKMRNVMQSVVDAEFPMQFQKVVGQDNARLLKRLPRFKISG